MSEAIALEGTPEVLDLPFVHETEDGDVFLWHPNPTGHQEGDILTGEYYARVAMVVAKDFNLPMLLACVLRDMVLAGKFSGVEAGFIAAVVSAAQVGSLN